MENEKPKEFKGISASSDNYQYLEELRQQMIKDQPYPRKVSINEALTVVVAFHRQRSKLNGKDRGNE